MTNHSLRWIRGSIAPRRPVPRGFDAMDPGFHPTSAPAPPNSMRWIRGFIAPRRPIPRGFDAMDPGFHRTSAPAPPNSMRWIRGFIAPRRPPRPIPCDGSGVSSHLGALPARFDAMDPGFHDHVGLLGLGGGAEFEALDVGGAGPVEGLAGPPGVEADDVDGG